MISSSSAVSDRTSSLTHLSDPRIRLGCFFSAYGRGGTGESSEEQEQEAADVTTSSSRQIQKILAGGEEEEVKAKALSQMDAVGGEGGGEGEGEGDGGIFLF